MTSVLKIRDENGNFIPINAIKGEDGKSAYEQAKEGGYNGTEEEFISLLNNLTNSSSGTGVGEAIPPTGSEIFNDYENNDTNISYAHIEGKNNKAIIKCFLIQSNDDYSVTLDSVEGIKVGMTCAIFYPYEPEIYERMRGRVGSIEGNVVTLILGTGVTLPKITPSTTGNFLNTFIVDGGSIGTTVIEDNDFEGFSLHMQGIDNIGYMNGFLSGTGNKVKSLWGVALGYKGEVQAERGFVANYKNKVTSSGFESAVFGSRNTAGAANSFLTGTDNTSYEGADGSLTCGRYNNIYAAWAAAFGYGLEARDGSCLYAGSYNEHVDKLHFCIGNGKSDSERSNAMTVDWYGNIVNSGNITANGDIFIGEKKEKVATIADVKTLIDESIIKALSTEV